MGQGTVSGMTGFGRASGEADWGRWTIEAKSVNGRSLDVRINLPSGFDAVERTIRTAASALFKRGSLQVAIRVDAEASDAASINGPLLDQLTDAWLERTGEQMIRAESLATLMTVRGVVEAGAIDLRALGEDEAVIAALSTGAQTALAGLDETRRREGADLTALLTGVLEAMTTEVEQATAAASDQPVAIKSRLDARLADLLSGTEIDPERASAEAAMMASKADVREELDRLTAHIAAGHELLEAGSPIGRKLDFLAQEMYREANTLCSKSASLPLTQAGLALKGLIDQFKEQAANVE